LSTLISHICYSQREVPNAIVWSAYENPIYRTGGYWTPPAEEDRPKHFRVHTMWLDGRPRETWPTVSFGFLVKDQGAKARMETGALVRDLFEFG